MREKRNPTIRMRFHNGKFPVKLGKMYGKKMRFHKKALNANTKQISYQLNLMHLK